MNGQKFARAFAAAAFEGAKAKRRARVFQRGELRLVLLHLISQEPRHGYDLIQQIEELTGGHYAPSPGIVYPTLTLMAEMDLIDEQVDDGGKKIYSITDAGTALLAEEEKHIADILARLEGIAQMDQAADGASIRRAMSNMKSAIRIRLADEEKGSEKILDVAAIIDEAASKIERMK
ncbi:PadR family transcriptional regulator [Parasphingorhabdus cellanae]|uniref:PadR family transcriptional regulator n=1 Tax=Parasphingorhabdus cellanae TaxID=2806553 RepID=A0ABX7T392_9SPHN|nr:PadR family transcriptional regulator [Parasphingorhabdus cellanae]QTD55616.1 PadR family transcriptional regulator [Parasphingorhabdus cellanae]